MIKDYHQAYVRLRSQPTGEWLVHPELRDRLVEDAGARQSNITEVASEILALHFGVKYTPNGRRSGVPRENAEILNMRIPLPIWKAIRRASMKSGRTEMNELRLALCKHYRLPMPVATIPL